MTGPERAVVLIVDDEPAVADAYAAHVREKHAVRTAYGGEAALSKLDDDVDVVLLDRRMPDLVGDEVLEQIRERGLDARVAMVTAVDADFDIVDMEFDDYVVKPVGGEKLLETIDRLLRCGEYERRLREYYRPPVPTSRSSRRKTGPSWPRATSSSASKPNARSSTPR